MPFLLFLITGYAFIYNHVFYYRSTILQFLIARRSFPSHVIGYTRFLQLIFSYICRNVVFTDDELLPIFKIFDKAFTDHKNMDKKNGFTSEVYIPQEVRQILHKNFPTQYGVANP